MFSDCMLLLHLDGGVPFSATPGYRDIPDRTMDITTLMKTYPSYLWQKDPSVIDFETLRKPYTISQSLFLKHRNTFKGLALIKAIPECPLHIPELLL